jgi:hypothetical protein
VVIRLHGYVSRARTGFWRTAEARCRRGEPRIKYLVAVCLFACFINGLFASLQRVFASTFVGRKCVIKERFSKKYRHPLLDSKLTLKRLNAVSLSNQHVIIISFLHVSTFVSMGNVNLRMLTYFCLACLCTNKEFDFCQGYKLLIKL